MLKKTLMRALTPTRVAILIVYTTNAPTIYFADTHTQARKYNKSNVLVEEACYRLLSLRRRKVGWVEK
jgi:hypothetical protein